MCSGVTIMFLCTCGTEQITARAEMQQKQPAPLQQCCRRGVSSPTHARRIDQVFINNGNGTYTQDVTNWTNLRDGEQGWSTAWGDIDNDGDNDAFVLNYSANSTLDINNGTGVF